jgi:hypothetical protein
MSWWDTNWQARQLIHSQTDGDGYTSGVHFLNVDVDLDGLVLNGLLRSDYKDLRVIYQSGTNYINTPYFVASGRDPERIFFPAQNDIPPGVDIGGHGSGWGYYLYFGAYADGDTSGLPPAYVNRNFPQAPYTATTTWYRPTGTASGYKDKCLYRLNDDPSIGSPSGFEDAAGFTSGLAVYGAGNTSGLYKGQTGRLDLATEFERANRGVLWVVDNRDGSTISSGNWCIDFWVYPYDTAGTQYWFVKKDNSNPSSPFAVASRYIYNSTYNAFSEWSTQQRTLFQSAYNQWDAGASAGVEANEWSHIRVYYAKKKFSSWSCVFLYVNGTRYGSQGNCAWPPGEPYFSQMESGNCTIGGAAVASNNEFDGMMEQFRYSTHPWFAQESLDEDNANSRFAPPDWKNNEYTTYLQGIELVTPPLSGSFGGYTEGTTDFVNISGIYGGYAFGANLGSGSFGGWAHSRHEITAIFGGYVPVMRGTVTATFGGLVLGFAAAAGICLFGAVASGVGIDNTEGFGGFANAQQRHTRDKGYGAATLSYAGATQEAFRGFTIGTWTSPDTIVESAARALVKSLADTQYRQKFTIDGSIALYAEQEAEFDAAIDVIKVQPSEFDSLMLITKTRRNPFISIIDTEITGSGPWSVVITASGYAFNKEGKIISSGLHHASMTWTDGDYTILPDVVVSGEILKFVHSYSASGLYKPIVAVRDKFGRTGSDDATVNLASGLSIPYIKLAATPRVGSAPPPFYSEDTLRVGFNQ